MIGRVLTAGLSTAYNVGRLAEGVKYWSDYRKNTGFRPRYPLRTMSRDIAPVFMIDRPFRRLKRW